MLNVSLLYYKKFCKYIKPICFEVNPYDTCMANRMVNGKQHTVACHFDYLKSIHGDPNFNDDFHKWLEKTYEIDDIGHVESSRGKVHEYLVMTLNYTEEGKLKIGMRKYLGAIVSELPHQLSDKVKCPWTENIFKVDEEENKLGDEKRTIFHSFLIKAMFLTKIGRVGVQPGIPFLDFRVK